MAKSHLQIQSVQTHWCFLFLTPTIKFPATLKKIPEFGEARDWFARDCFLRHAV